MPTRQAACLMLGGRYFFHFGELYEYEPENETDIHEWELMNKKKLFPINQHSINHLRSVNLDTRARIYHFERVWFFRHKLERIGEKSL